jgi:hypothetical protein
MIDERIKEVGMKHLVVMLFTSCAVTGMYGMERTDGVVKTDSPHRFVTVKNEAPVLIEVQTRQMFGLGKGDWNGKVQEVSPWQHVEPHTSAEFKWLLEYVKMNAGQRPELYTIVTNRVLIRLADERHDPDESAQPLPTRTDYANDQIITVGMADGSLYFE